MPDTQTSVVVLSLNDIFIHLVTCYQLTRKRNWIGKKNQEIFHLSHCGILDIFLSFVVPPQLIRCDVNIFYIFYTEPSPLDNYILPKSCFTRPQCVFAWFCCNSYSFIITKRKCLLSVKLTEDTHTHTPVDMCKKSDPFPPWKTENPAVHSFDPRHTHPP